MCNEKESTKSRTNEIKEGTIKKGGVNPKPATPPPPPPAGEGGKNKDGK